MKITSVLILIFMNYTILAQPQTFDIITYTAPTGWKKETTEAAIQFTKQDEAKGAYCIITLMKSLPSGGTSKENFDAAWETVVKEMVKPSSAPEMQPVANEDGWEAQSGHAPFQTDELNGVAVLVTTTGYQRMVNILILTNSDIYEKEMTAFLESANFKKSATENNSNTGSNLNKQQINQPSKNDGFTYNTINFDDGWTSSIKEDWVEVRKGNMKVLLFYTLPYNGSDFSGTGLVERDYFWDNYVSKYFTIQTKQYQDNGEVMGSFKPKYVEGWATNKQTGEKVFIAMRLSIAPNAVYITLASAPDEATIRNQFPKANDKYTSDLADMSRYNKFAVGKNDMIGTWSDSGGGTMSWYSSATGQYVGATGASTSQRFVFNANGTYSSEHKGGYGVVGAMNTYQQNYKGEYSVSNWQITATKRWDGKTETFDAWFEVVRGGRILHLDTPGIKYTLFKEK